MSTSFRQTQHEVRSDVGEPRTRYKARQALLASGIAYAVLYPVVNDAIAATLYDGYSRMSQAVSELSATGAPPRPFLSVVGPVFSLLQIGFGVGMWQSAHGSRPIQVAGALVVGHGGMSLLWIFAPMSQREVIAAGGATSADTMHLLLAAGTGLFVTAYVAIFAIGFGWLFRVYSAFTLATALVFGRLSAQVDQIEAGDPTPYMGLLERIGIGAWLLWLAVASVVLLRRNRALFPGEAPGPAPTGGSRTPVTVLLYAGIAGVSLYVFGDVVSTLLYDGYSYRDQAISELSAFGSPVRPLMVTVILIHGLLVAAFGVGIVRSADRNTLRWVGFAMVGAGLVGFPTHTAYAMSSRGMEPGFNDTMHIILSGLFSLLMITAIVLSAVAYRGRFRAFASATVLVVIAFGVAASFAIQGIEEDLTPWAGGFERISAYAYFAWIVVLAVTLNRRQSQPEGRHLRRELMPG